MNIYNVLKWKFFSKKKAVVLIIKRARILITSSHFPVFLYRYQNARYSNYILHYAPQPFFYIFCTDNNLQLFPLSRHIRKLSFPPLNFRAGKSENIF